MVSCNLVGPLLLQKSKLEWVEFGRGLAALAVVLSHTFMPGFPDYLSFCHLLGRWGVAFFFVLSGFIIYHVHSGDLGAPERALNFAWRRFIRIFPTYWLVVFVALFVRQYLGNPEYRVPIDAAFVVGQIFMIPQELFIPVAWSLRYELLFYSLFFVVILNFRIGVALFSLWLVFIIYRCTQSTACNLITISDPRCPIEAVQHTIIDGYLNLYFFCGMGIGAILSHNRIWTATAATSCAALLLYGYDEMFNSVWVLAIAQLVCCCLVCWAVALSKSLPAPKIARWMGQVSYPVLSFSFDRVQHCSRPDLSVWICRVGANIGVGHRHSILSRSSDCFLLRKTSIQGSEPKQGNNRSSPELNSFSGRWNVDRQISEGYCRSNFSNAS